MLRKERDVEIVEMIEVVVIVEIVETVNRNNTNLRVPCSKLIQVNPVNQTLHQFKLKRLIATS